MTTLNDRQIIKKLTLRHVVLQAPPGWKKILVFPSPPNARFFYNFFLAEDFFKNCDI